MMINKTFNEAPLTGPIAPAAMAPDDRQPGHPDLVDLAYGSRSAPPPPYAN